MAQALATLALTTVIFGPVAWRLTRRRPEPPRMQTPLTLGGGAPPNPPPRLTVEFVRETVRVTDYKGVTTPERVLAAMPRIIAGEPVDQAEIRREITS